MSKLSSEDKSIISTLGNKLLESFKNICREEEDRNDGILPRNIMTALSYFFVSTISTLLAVSYNTHKSLEVIEDLFAIMKKDIFEQVILQIKDEK